jgi:hypothetical protein
MSHDTYMLLIGAAMSVALGLLLVAAILADEQEREGR